MEKESNYFAVRNEEDLIEGIKRKEEHMLVKGEFNDEVKALIDTKLTDDELLGLELGSSGWIHIFSELVYKLVNVFSSEPKEKKKLEDAIRQYNVKLDKEKRVILYLRQFDY